MPSVLLVAFLVQFALHVVNAVGGSRINDLLWQLYTLLPSQNSKDEQEIGRLRRDVVRLQREMNATSAQDNFAKWARLRREHDKAKDKYDKISRSQRGLRSTFDRIVGALRFLFTQGVNFFLNTWYSKQPMYWLPHGWFPHSIEWVLSCPRAPLGSISVNVWGLACGTVIALVSEAITTAYKYSTSQRTAGPAKPQSEKTPMKVPADQSKQSEKKEL